MGHAATRARSSIRRARIRARCNRTRTAFLRHAAETVPQPLVLDDKDALGLGLRIIPRRASLALGDDHHVIRRDHPRRLCPDVLGGLCARLW